MNWKLRLKVFCGIFLLPLSWAGCGQNEIQVYRAAKETPPAPSISEPSEAQISWTTPSGWKELSPSGMRLGSFTVSESGGKVDADVSIIRLEGEAGGTLANVNRWRSQLELEAVTEAELARQASQLRVGNAQVTLVNIANPKPIGNPPQRARILAAIFPQESSTIFVKMTGKEDVVASQKAKFVQLVQSLRFSSLTPSSEAPASPSASAPWKAPSHWKEQPPSAMRKGSFLITGKSGAQADVSITSFGGMAGGLLANVNRWRGQIGLPALTESELGKNTETIDLHGVRFTLVNMIGPSPSSGKKQRILGAITPHGQETWFFKISGADSLVQSQKPELIEFLKSVKLP